jgi:iron complex transport system permease protein
MPRLKLLKWIVYALPLPVIIGSLFIGPADQVSGFDVVSLLLGKPVSGNSELIQAIVLDIRLPRILLVFFVGAVLSVSGAALQAVFRNPLVSPYVLGLSSGAAFGAALAMWASFFSVQLSAFIFGMLAVALSYYMAQKHKTVSIVSLILAGIITNGIFTALLTIVQVLSDPFKLQSIVHWTMGNFHNANWEKFNSTIFPMLAGLVILFLLGWKMNVIALGDEEAQTAGINPRKMKGWILVAATLSGSAAVAVAGIIGLYGLVVPHAVRMMFGVDNRQAIGLNFFLGGSFLILIDDISRSLATFEIPIGVFTMLVGAPLFIYLLKKSNIGWEN